MWKFIWSHNGRIYVKKNETATEQHAFDNADDFTKFKERFNRDFRMQSRVRVSTMTRYFSLVENLSRSLLLSSSFFSHSGTLLFNIVQVNIFELTDRYTEMLLRKQ